MMLHKSFELFRVSSEGHMRLDELTLDRQTSDTATTLPARL